MAGPAAVVDPLVALEALGAVEHPVEHPGVGMVVHAALSSWRAHDRVDREMVVGIDVEQQVLVSLGRGPSRRMRLEIGIPEEPLEQRLRLLHPAPILGLRGPEGPQVADELLENRQSRARHGSLRSVRYSDSNRSPHERSDMRVMLGDAEPGYRFAHPGYAGYSWSGSPSTVQRRSSR